MKYAILFVALVACSKPKRIAECDKFQATVDKISKCATLPASAKDDIARAGKQLEDAFKMLDQAGGIDNAPSELQDSLRDTCKAQDRSITETYQKVVPDCLK